MKLLNGVTGFYQDPKDKPPTTSLKQFKVHSYEAARTNNRELLECNDTNVHSNFFVSTLKIQEKEVYVLLNKHYPLVAFASSINEDGIIYVNDTHLSLFFSPFYRVVHADFLNKRLIYTHHKKTILLKNKNELNNAELVQIAYWKPNTLGEILYNYWD